MRRLFEIEEKYEGIYEKYDFDFTFGGKGFAIIESEEEQWKYFIHTLDRKDIRRFEGFDWILVVHTEMDEILHDVNSHRESLLILVIMMTGAAALLRSIFC